MAVDITLQGIDPCLFGKVRTRHLNLRKVYVSVCQQVNFIAFFQRRYNELFYLLRGSQLIDFKFINTNDIAHIPHPSVELFLYLRVCYLPFITAPFEAYLFGKHAGRYECTLFVKSYYNLGIICPIYLHLALQNHQFCSYHIGNQYYCNIQICKSVLLQFRRATFRETAQIRLFSGQKY